jgi:hypothetical protein
MADQPIFRYSGHTAVTMWPDPEVPQTIVHDGWPCTIVRQLTKDEADVEVGPMYLIRFADGIEVSAFADELKDA